MIEKQGFIYIWYDRKRKMYYIGCHWGTENDGYICSSNRMRDAYRRRPDDFKRRILQLNVPRDQLLVEEYKWLSMISDEEIGKKYYNHSKKHFGHWTTNPEKVLTMRERNLGANNPRFGKKHSEETKEKMRGPRQPRGPLSDSHRRNLSASLKGMKSPLGMLGKKHNDKTKQIMSEKSSGKNNAFFGKTHSEETKRKISEARKNKKHSEETKRIISEAGKT